MTASSPVIGLFCAGGMSDFLDNALMGLDAVGIPLETVVVGCPSPYEAEIRQVIGSRACSVHALPEAIRGAPGVDVGYHHYGTSDFVAMMWLKVRFVRALLEVHEHVVYADVDVVWLRNPLPYLAQVAERFPIAFQTEGQGSFPPAVCCGFVSLRREERSIAFLDALIAEDAAREAAGRRTDDQVVAQHVIDSDLAWLAGMSFLPESLFVNGLGHALMDPSASASALLAGELRPFVFHANWAIGRARKIRLMESVGQWGTPVLPLPTGEVAEIAVVYPVFQVRGDEVERIRSWTQEQDLDGRRYRVIVVVGPDTADDLEAIRGLLRPQDQLLVTEAPGRDVDYWQAGADRTTTPWLLFVEGHVLARPDCLSRLLAWVADHPEAAAVSCVMETPDVNRISPVLERWFADVQREWAAPGGWPRLTRAAFAVRRDVLLDVGSLRPEYGQFAPELLSAMLHERGWSVDVAVGARIIHVDSLMDGFREDNGDFVLSGLDARADLPAPFFETYFGPSPVAGLGALPARTTRQLSGGLIRAFVADPMPAVHCIPAAGRLLPHSVLGLNHRIGTLRTLSRIGGWSVMHVPMPAELRWRMFIRAHRRLIRAEQLSWASRHPATALGPAVGAARCTADALGPGAVLGMHGLEQLDGLPFRWTEPVFALRVDLLAGLSQIRLETGSVRRPLARALRAIVVDGRRLPDRDVLVRDDGSFSVRVGREVAGPVWMTVVTRALREPGGRRLGLPLFAVGARD